MELGNAGLGIITEFEPGPRDQWPNYGTGIAPTPGPALRAYMPTPHDVPTIGYGHTDGVQMGDTCTVEEAEQWLREDTEWAVETANLVSAPLTQNQFDAIVSLIFNIGKPLFLRSTLLRKLNIHDFHGAADEFVRWNKQHGTVLRGLTRRRVAERELFLTPNGFPLVG